MASMHTGQPTLTGRFSDIAKEPRTMLMPIEGFEKMPLVSLEDAVEPLLSLVRDVKARVWIAKQRCENPPDKLTPDESASIMLYTIEWEPSNDSLYFILNSTLRTENRTKLKPWFSYLKLLLTALSKLPSIDGHTVYRGIKLDMSYMYPQGETFVWWGFSSCTTTIDVLEQEQFFGKTGTRTFFMIECKSGRDIHRHSYIEKENEVLLLPAIQLKVIACSNQSGDLHMIQIREVKPPYHLLKPLPDLSSPNVTLKEKKSAKRSLSIWNVPLIRNFILPRAHQTYQNSDLVERIAKGEPCSSIYLERQSLTDQDMTIVIEQAMVNKQCTILCLPSNKITSQGASVLAEALYDNTTLERLDIFNNRVGDEGAHFLAEVLTENNSTLKSLKLGWNGITDKGVDYLAEMLTKNRTLIELSLPWNRISDRGVKSLANVLIRYNTTLEKLSLDLNDSVNDSSVNFLIDIMNQNLSLTALDVHDCKLSKAGKARLFEVAKSKKNFELGL